MIVVLSQKIDSESPYNDELFKLYHYPARYKNQLQTGDSFIYYQGNRFVKEQRYYFGAGKIGSIQTTDGEEYYAELTDCCQFEKNVPIYLPDGGYIEQLGYETVRERINPPWQSSIRPLSQEAYDYILNAAGDQEMIHETCKGESLETLKDRLKAAVREFYVEGDQTAIHRIENIAATIGQSVDEPRESISSDEVKKEYGKENVSGLLEYCRNMKMTYSYKPVLILALLQAGNGGGAVSVRKAASYFIQFYADRRLHGLSVEKKPCIYLREGVTLEETETNIVENPVKALVKSGYFEFEADDQIFSIIPDIWNDMDDNDISALTKLCLQRLADYYSD